MQHIDDWSLAGGGMEGESYVSRSHPELIMKVYNFSQAESVAGNEFRQVRELGRLGVSVPEALELTRFDGRPALVSRRIMGKKSFCRLAGERPEIIPDLAGRMAGMARQLHSITPRPGSSFPSAMDKYRRLLESNTVLDERGKAAVSAALDAIAADDRPTLLHGDLHFGNVITDGDRDYFIDLGDVSCGNPNHDIAMFYVATHYGCDHSFGFLYHMTWSRALEFWEAFKTAYYGRAVSDAEVFAVLRDYMLARCVWFKDGQIQTTLCSLLLGENCPLTAEIRLAALGEL